MQNALETIKATDIRDSIADHVSLDLEGRQKRRIVLKTQQGEEFMINLAHTLTLGDGDAFKLEDGRLIGVIAAPESLYEIKGQDRLHMLRLAWHLGNRHLATEITPEALYIREDHVIGHMIEGLGGRVSPLQRPFQPESGAYAVNGHHHD